MADLWSALQRRRRVSGAAPLVTYHDPEGGDRAELSAISVENAASKIANALHDEYGLEPGGAVRLLLPVHWQRTAWCAGTWAAGCTVVLDEHAPADLEVAPPPGTGPGSAAVSLHPLGLPGRDALEPGTSDATSVVRMQPDAFLGVPPAGACLALRAAEGEWSQEEVLVRAGSLADEWGLEPGGRLAVGLGLRPFDAWLAALAVPLARDGCVILIPAAGEAFEHAARAERATAIAR